MNPILVEVLRGGHVESRHAGALAVLDADGGVLAAIGDIDRPVFPRSAVKVLQALPLVASGAADQLQLGDAELALACASHGGEDAAREHGRRDARQGRAGRRLPGMRHPLAVRRQSPRASWRRAARSLRRCTTTARASTPASCAWPVPAGRPGRRPAPVRQGLREARAPGDARSDRGARSRHRRRPGQRTARHRRLLDTDLRDPAAPPRARLRARRHRHRAGAGPCARGAAAARGRRDAHRSWSPAAAAWTRA